MMHFYYQDFYAALPGFIGVDAVREALAAPSAVTAAGELPACPAPVMLRRRLTPLGKLVASALAAVQLRDEEPFVVASSWGDSGKSCQLVSEMTATGDVSPAGFTSSVHNAASGAAGIWLKNHAPAPAVSAGNFTTEAGLTESFLQLQTSESVVLVRAEAPLPDVWDHPAHERLRSLRLGPAAHPAAVPSRFLSDADGNGRRRCGDRPSSSRPDVFALGRPAMASHGR